jgi:hypothetical protein
MADAVTTQTIADGPGQFVRRFTNVSDGTGESAVKKIAVANLGGTPAEVKIDRIKYTTKGMAVRILWDADADVEAITLPADEAGELDFRAEGGLINNAGAGKTGDINFTTVDHSTGDSYDITLFMRPKN